MKKDDSLRDEELDGVCGGMYPAAGGGSSTAMAPDVCMTPADPAPFVPAPGSGSTASATSKKVAVAGAAVACKASNLPMSTGDEAGTLTIGLMANRV